MIHLQLNKEVQKVNLEELDTKTQKLLTELRQTHEFIAINYIY